MNSMESFKAALDSEIVKIVELDVSLISSQFQFFPSIFLQVWMTKDEQIVVVHGGDNGNINFGNGKDKYIFESTLEECRSFETRFSLPTLREVFKLFSKRLLVNIEIKVPDLLEVKAVYNWKKTVSTIFQ